MKRIFTSILIAITSISLNAVKLNQRGEKMVSEISVEYSDSAASKGSPYSIKFGYNNNNEINSIHYERKGVNHEVARIKRNSNGNISREDFSDGELISRYSFNQDESNRISEMVWYEKNIYGKFVKIHTFKYDYNFQDFELSVINYDHGDHFAALRESVRITDHNAYVYANVINLSNGNESTIKERDHRVSYSEHDDDLNIDLSQIIRGYCNVGGCFLNLPLDNNFLMLAQWIPLKSKKLLSSVHTDKIEYNYTDSVHMRADVRGYFTNTLQYSITLKYVE